SRGVPGRPSNSRKVPCLATRLANDARVDERRTFSCLRCSHPAMICTELLMPDIINEYQKWKQEGEDLRVQAKHAMENRFRDLLSEAVQIADEYRADFGAALKPPPAVTAFRYKATAKLKAKKPAGKAKPPAA